MLTDKPNVFVSDRNIISEDHQNELMVLGAGITFSQFRIGDIANHYIRLSSSTGSYVPAYRIHQAVGRFCGKSERTIRSYAETAAFFDKSTREEYGMLPFSFFVFAKSTDERWEDVLQLAALNPYMTREQLMRSFASRFEPVVPDDDEPISRREEVVASSSGYSGAQIFAEREYRRASPAKTLAKITDLIAELGGLSETIESEDLRNQIAFALSYLRGLCVDLERSIKIESSV